MDQTHTEFIEGETELPAVPTLPRIKPLFRGLMASHLLPADKRHALQIVYDYLATLRAVADTPGLEDETREYLLEEMEDVLQGEARPVFTAFTLSAARLANFFADNEVALQGAQRLLQAARRDVSRSTCTSWSDLMLYCRYAAEPLGRITLGLYNISSPEALRSMDALMAALAVMRMMRRAGTDWRVHGRCYLPTDWFDEEGSSTEHLSEYEMNVGVRKVFDRTLERVDQLIQNASTLPQLVKDSHLRGEMTRLVYIAQAEHKQLCRYDALEQQLVTTAGMRWGGWWAGFRARLRR